MTTPLAGRLAARIAATGPITVAEYMATCLLDPEHGYYTTRDPLGQSGDFITAPEISQMFGELLGLWVAQCWIDQGRPAPFCLAEPGPGRGTLMADMLRATSRVPGFVQAAEIRLIEASPTLRTEQKRTLDGTGIATRWLDTLDALPEMPLFLVANEFLDALPIRQFVRAEQGGWHERQIGLDPDGALRFALAPATRLAALDGRHADTAPGELVELCPSLPGTVGTVARRIVDHGGAALFVDYGGWRSRGDTLQAVRHHKPAPVLDNPGTSDLTAHVDFEAVADVLRSAGLHVSGMTPQGVLLERLGITARAQALAAGLTGDARAAHVAAHRRLTHPDEMGSLFKVVGCVPANVSLPAGLSE